MQTTQPPSLAAQQRFWDWHWQHWKERKTICGWKDQRHETVCNFLGSLQLSNPEIIDLGCGPGWYTEKLTRFGKVTGVDLSSEAIAMAAARFPNVSFQAGNFYELPLPTQHFDVVVSQEVIDHVEDRTTFLDRAATLLKPHGHMVLACNNKFVMDRLDEGVFPKQPDEHIAKFLTVRGWKRLLRPQFNVLRIRTLVMIGNRGLLRVVNSSKLNTALGFLLGRRRLEALKEWAGFGYIIVILARKKT